MPRPDYERFLKTYCSDRFSLKHKGNDKNCLIAFARVYDNRKTTCTDPIPWCKEQTGVWIDVFPADGTPESEEDRKKMFKRAKWLWINALKARQSMATHLSDENGFFRKFKLFNRKVRYLNGKAIGFFIHEQLKLMQQVAYGSTEHFQQMAVMDAKDVRIYPVKSFNHLRTVPFEDTEVMMMENYDEILRTDYGDYMKLPPENERKGPDSLGNIKFYWK
jgi:lipopolysaccharide cholinephosphotransferase